MGFTDFVSETGLSLLNSWLTTRSYVTGYGPSQADVVSFKAITNAPDVTTYPHAHRWYKHMSTYETDFSSLPGDPSKAFTTYGPEAGAAVVNPSKAAAAADDDDIDLFGSDDEEEDVEAVKQREKNLEEYRKKKAGKVKPAAKSIVTLDVKPWDDETDLKEMEVKVRSIQKDGLVWAAAKFVAVGFGIKKLQINLVVEDEKVSIDELQAQIEEFEDYVQSTDVAAMQKL